VNKWANESDSFLKYKLVINTWRISQHPESNQNDTESPSPQSEWPSSRKPRATNAGEDWDRGRDPYTPLVGMQISAASMEISVEVPQKTKTRLTVWASYFSLVHMSEGMWIDNQHDTCTPRLLAALLTIAKIKDQPKFPSTNEQIKKCGMYPQWSIIQP
jgi:hypothetical protein